MQPLHILWFRNDLRLKYNRILENLYEKNIAFLPLFILDPNILNSKYTSNFRKTFLYESLVNLDTQFKKFGSKLVLINDNPINFFRQLLNKYSKIYLHHSKDYTQFAQNRDKEIKKLFESYNQKVITYKNIVIIDEQDKVLNKAEQPFKVFTQFKKNLLNKINENPHLIEFSNYQINALKVSVINNILKEITTNLLEVAEIQNLIDKSNIIPGGETKAQEIWYSFKKTKLNKYNLNRNFLDIDGTSKLSPHLKFGTISPIQILKELIKFEDLASQTFLSEIIWREFYKYINIYFPFVETSNFNKLYDDFEWIEDDILYEKWCNGETGIPIIDANMRCLKKTGWMHNRGRMIVASFLCKNIGIHWRKGELYFQQLLIDWDKTSNNGGWQWSAGTGTDAAPYFRIFNPILQSKKFDPNGFFIKKHVKELKNVPTDYIHEPYKMPKDLQIKIGCIIGKNYPTPIIDLEISRKKALQRYNNIIKKG